MYVNTDPLLVVARAKTLAKETAKVTEDHVNGIRGDNNTGEEVADRSLNGGKTRDTGI
jgi:hypothetical protein